MVTGKIISNKEAIERYNLNVYDPFGRMGFSNVLFFEGDLHIKGNTLILIDGNLKVDGILAPAEDYMPFLFVKGNVSCDVLYSFDEVIYIDGDAKYKICNSR